MAPLYQKMSNIIAFISNCYNELMGAKYGHWAVAGLIVFIAALLGFATLQNYNLLALNNNISDKINLGCSERLNGQVTIKTPVSGATLLVSLDFSVNRAADNRSALVKGDSYAIGVGGTPTKDSVWTLHAYYFDAKGQLSETAQQFSGITCGQKITADLAL